MSPEMVWFLGSQVVLVINITTLQLALHRKYKLLFSIGMFVLLDLALFTVLILTGETPGASRSITGFVFTPLVIWLFNEMLFQKVFAVFLTLQFTVGLTSLANGLADLFVRSGGGEYTPIHFSIALVLLIGYCILVFKLGRGVLNKLFRYGRQAEWALYSLAAVFSYSVMLFVNDRFNGLEQIFLILFILWGFAVLCFAIINTHEKTRKSAEAEFAKSVVSSGRDHYQKMDKMHEKLRILRHDYKYHLTAIGELAASGDNDAIAGYLTAMQTQLSENELRDFCSDNVINALLSGYADRCLVSDVKFDVLVSLPETLTIPAFDLCIILGNLLENAMEACEKLVTGKYIELRLKPLGRQLALIVVNSFDGKLASNDDKHSDGGRHSSNDGRNDGRITANSTKIISTKKEGGYGLMSVEAVVARYDGELTVKWDGNAFTAGVTMRL